MPAHRLSMRKTREILRLRWGLGLAGRMAARSCKVSASTVHDVLARAKLAGLSWPLPAELDDAALEALLYPGKPASRHRPLPDCAAMYRELRQKGVTLQLLWHEYRMRYPDNGLGYSAFCERYRAFRKKLEVTMRQEHRAGEKMFVDYAGQTIGVTDPETGEVTQLQVFVATLGASNYTYCEVHASQDLRCWTMAHMRAFEFFGGVPEATVPDNLKAGVSKPCFYEPDVNPTYQELAEHYGTVVLPTRVRKPRDKAKVENAVLQVERWVLAPLRKQTFFNVTELRRVVAERLQWLNNRPLSKLNSTRRSLFNELDRPALKPLPARRYSPSEWKNAAVNIDYHVEYDRHYYSVPYTLARKRVDIRATSTTIECIYNNKRVAVHRRNYDKRNRFTTKPEHMPSAHRRHLEWSPSRLIRWASTIGPNTERMAEAVLKARPHPEQGYRSCLGILRLSKKYGHSRLEAACSRALTIKSYSYRSVESILKNGLDQQPIDTKRPIKPEPIQHNNIRGADYYQ